MENFPRSQFKVIIFDCDGVMFDSRQANIVYYNTILNHFGKPLLTNGDIEVVHMATAEEAVNYLFKDDPRLSEAQKFRQQLDYQKLIPLMKMEPFLKEVLSNLKENHFYLAIATNRTNTIHSVLTTFELEKFFDLVISSLDVERPKPYPEIIFKILSYFKVKASEAVYIGDSIIDYETARKAQVFFVSYKNQKLKGDYHISDFRELLPLLQSNLKPRH
jgi:HAD superfamily hydrolase (TIGR01549 family)